MNEILLSTEEYESLQNLIDGNLTNITFSEIQDENYLMFIDDDSAEVLSQKVKDTLVLEGFDINYNINDKGRLFERLVDKFGEIGW